MKANILKNQKGISLIEILVTTLILGVGLLGVAALQVTSLSSSQEALFASQASAIAEDYASRIRSTRVSTMTSGGFEFPAILAEYHNGDNAAFVCGANVSPMCRSNAGGGAENCTMAQLAAYDKWEVCRSAQEMLPGGEVRVLNSGLRLTIVIDWDSAEARQDTGNVEVVNNNCVGLTGSADRNCMILELVP